MTASVGVGGGEMVDGGGQVSHWTEDAERVYARCSLFGLVGESPNGDLLLPSVSRRKRRQEGGWWDRRLDLRRPWHWPSYLRSRFTRRLSWLDD